jgi:acyl dehydratase
MRRPLSADLVGLELTPVSTSWTDKDVMLYALGVGARPPEDLRFVYEGLGPVVVPTYGVIPGLAAMGSLFGEIEIDPTMILHGEQAITCHRTIPPNASVEIRGRIDQVWDKGKAAVIGFEGTAADEDGDLFTAAATLFVRGAGGFGGDRGPSSAGTHAPPSREPDVVVTHETRPEQAAIYRLSGDRNPLHVDPEFARLAGFDGPFNHGLCTFGFVGRAVVDGVFDGDVDAFGSLEGRFADQVWPGDSITTKMWRTDDGALLEVETQKGNVVLSQAKATAR